MRIGACHDVDADGFVTATDEDIVDQHQANEGQALYDYHYDLNGDGVVSEVDVTLVAAQASTFCPDTANIDYDGSGLRIRLKVRPVEEDPVNTTAYVWDAAASLPVIVQETTNDATTSYVYALDMLSATDNSNVTTYFLQDGLGSTTGLTDDSGGVTDTYAYDVFGATKSHTGSSANAWLFTGELQDSPVGRSPYYLRARYYDPAIGRFLTRDPLLGSATMPQSLNRYPYVLNNPGLLVDPTGMCVFGLPCPKPIDRGIDKVGDFVECAADIPGCVKSTTEKYVIAPGLDRLGQAELAQCVREHGIEGCALSQANRAADWGARHVARALVGEKGYIDINLTMPLTPWAGGVTVGVQLDAQKGLLKYAGVGFMTPGLSITEAPGQNASTGVVCGLQGMLGRVGGQVGSTVSRNPTLFGEVGAGFPGVSATCFWVFD